MNIAEMVDERLVSFGFEAQNRDEVFGISRRFPEWTERCN